MLEKAYEFLKSVGRPRICVIGDMMLDTYVWGEVSRISPEGPIPVLHVQEREQRVGGAGSVCAMLHSLGAEVRPVGIIGQDHAGEALRRQLQEAGTDASGLVVSNERPTTSKTRYLGYVQSAGRALQQLLRADDEQTAPLSDADSLRVRDAALSAMQWADLAILQDMGKGLLNADLIRELVRVAREGAKPVVVDPELTEDYSPYEGATCVLPNRFETEIATGLVLRSPEDYGRAAHVLLSKLSLEGVVIKLDREGIYFATAKGEEKHITPQAREVADVTGAGDMVAAAFSLALAGGADYATAVNLANFAAGLEVNFHGATPLTRAQVLAALQAAADPTARKIVRREDIERLVAELRRAGNRLVFTNGCFDLLHLGHIQLLRYARAQGDAVIVGLNSDVSARRLKGAGRPINSEDVRSRVLAAIADVDYVVLFDEKSVLSLVKQIRPDVLVKGGDYSLDQVVGHEFVESYGGEVRLAPQAEGFSTTELIDRIAGENERADQGNSA